MKTLLKFLQEDNGNQSTTRLVLLIFTLTVIVVWAALSLCLGALQIIPESVVTIFIALTVGKVVQKGIESK